MTEPVWPKTVLCATDLSSRCDRALDRAALLAKGWHARLVVVHALETTPEILQARMLHDLPSWRRPEDRTDAVARQLREELLDTGSDPTIVVAAGEPAQVILDETGRQQADLIVTGVARGELFGRRLLGATVETLVRRADIPLLVVRGRPRRPYRHIVLATDFSVGSRHALETATRFFEPATVSIFHAYRAVTGGVLAAEQTRSGWQSLARQDVERFLAEAQIAEADKRAFPVLVEEGDPATLLRDYVHATGVELVVCGAPGRGPVLEILLGSTAQRLVERLPCDVLVVRPPRVPSA